MLLTPEPALGVGLADALGAGEALHDGGRRLRAREPRVHDGDVDAGRAELVGEILRHRGHGHVAHRPDGRPCRAGRRARDVDDAAPPAAAHVRRDRLRAAEIAEHLHVHVVPEELLGDVGQLGRGRLAGRHRGAVDEDVDAAQGVDRPLCTIAVTDSPEPVSTTTGTMRRPVSAASSPAVASRRSRRGPRSRRRIPRRRALAPPPCRYLDSLPSRWRACPSARDPSPHRGPSGVLTRRNAAMRHVSRSVRRRRESAPGRPPSALFERSESAPGRPRSALFEAQRVGAGPPTFGIVRAQRVGAGPPTFGIVRAQRVGAAEAPQ